MSNILDIIINMTKKGSGDKRSRVSGLQKLNKGFQDLTGISLGAATGLALVGKGLQEGIKFLKESVNETVAYNKQIREMTQVTGLGADQISRIVQVGDDWGVSIESIHTSLAFMNKQGITPSIDKLAELADGYVNSTDKAKWANEAVKTLGRGYETLIPLLALGGDGLRDATAAIKDNMVATEESIDASRKYEVAVDDLTDAWTGFKYEVGNNVIPILTDLMNSFADARNEEEKQVDVINQLKQAHALGLISMLDVNQANFDLQNGTKDVTEVTAEYKDILDQTTNAIAGAAAGLVPYSDYIEDAGEETVRLRVSTDDANKSTQIFRGSLDKTTTSALDNATAIENANKSMDNLNSFINGTLGPTIDNYIDSQGDIEQKMKDVQAEIDLAISQGYSPLGSKILGLQGQYDDLKGQYEENATAHADATRRILFDIISQQAAVGGLTETEVGMLTRIAEGWGIIDDDTAEATLRASEAFSYLASSGDVAGAFAMLDDMDEAWLDVAGEIGGARTAAEIFLAMLNEMADKRVRIDVDVVYNQGQMPTPGVFVPPPSYASGANFVVPPGYPNDSYHMNVESGEHVTITPAGGNTTNTNTWNIHTNAPIDVYGRDYNMRKAMAG